MCALRSHFSQLLWIGFLKVLYLCLILLLCINAPKQIPCMWKLALYKPISVLDSDAFPAVLYLYTNPKTDNLSFQTVAVCFSLCVTCLFYSSHLHSLSEPQGTLPRLAAVVTLRTMVCSFRQFTSSVSFSVISFIPISWPAGVEHWLNWKALKSAGAHLFYSPSSKNKLLIIIQQYITGCCFYSISVETDSAVLQMKLNQMYYFSEYLQLQSYTVLRTDTVYEYNLKLQ